MQGGNESIYGDSGNDTVEVYYLPSSSFDSSGLFGGDGTDIIQIDVAQNSTAQNIDFRPNGVFDLSNGSHFSEFEVIRLNTGSGDDYLRISLESNYYNTWNATTGNDHVTLDCTSQTESITARLGNAGEWGTVATPDWILCELFDVESLTFISGSGNDIVTGALGDDDLFGNAGNDSLFGGDGNDALLGQTGNDSLTGGNGADSLGGGEGNDTLFGENGDDRLVGSLGDDLIVAGAGNDILQGGGGSDRLFSSTGTDQIYAGIDTVRDVFIFRSTLDSTLGASRDVVYNFVSGIDGFNLIQIDANAALANDQAFAFSGTTAQANSVWYVSQGADLLVFGDVDGNATRDFSIRLVGVTSLMADDFLL